MSKNRQSGLIVGTLVLIATFMIFGSTVNTPWLSIPESAVNSIAFSLSFGLGLDHVVACATALATLGGLFYIGYAIGSRIHYKLK